MVRDGPRLLLITNRKSYTGSRLAPNSMTLDGLECQNRGFMNFWRFLDCDTFKEQIAPNSLQIGQDKLAVY